MSTKNRAAGAVQRGSRALGRAGGYRSARGIDMMTFMRTHYIACGSLAALALAAMAFAPPAGAQGFPQTCPDGSTPRFPGKTATEIETCGLDGDVKAGSPEGLQNEKKNNFCAQGNATPIDISKLTTLENSAESAEKAKNYKAGEPPPERSFLTPLGGRQCGGVRRIRVRGAAGMRRDGQLRQRRSECRCFPRRPPLHARPAAKEQAVGHGRFARGGMRRIRSGDDPASSSSGMDSVQRERCRQSRTARTRDRPAVLRWEPCTVQQRERRGFESQASFALGNSSDLCFRRLPVRQLRERRVGAACDFRCRQDHVQ